MLTNRQPTLHKPGMMGHRARVMRCERRAWRGGGSAGLQSRTACAGLPGCGHVPWRPLPQSPTTLLDPRPVCSRAHHPLPLRQLLHLQRRLRWRRDQPAPAAGGAECRAGRRHRRCWGRLAGGPQALAQRAPHPRRTDTPRPVPPARARPGRTTLGAPRATASCTPTSSSSCPPTASRCAASSRWLGAGQGSRARRGPRWQAVSACALSGWRDPACCAASSRAPTRVVPRPPSPRRTTLWRAR